MMIKSLLPMIQNWKYDEGFWGYITPKLPLMEPLLEPCILWLGRQDVFFFFFPFHKWLMRKSRLSDKNGTKKFYFPEVPKPFWAGEFKVSRYGYSKHVFMDGFAIGYSLSYIKLYTTRFSA